LSVTLATYLSSRFPLWGIGLPVYESVLRGAPFLLTLVYWMNYYNYGVSLLATLFISLNRLTAVLYPLGHDHVKIYHYFYLYPKCC
jgi:hypothetical protein